MKPYLGVLGAGGGGTERASCVTRASPGDSAGNVHFAAARTCGRALGETWESQSSSGDRQGRSWGPRAIPGRESGGHVGTPGGLRGCTFGSSEHDFRSAGRLGRLKFGFHVPGSARYGRIQQSCAPSFFPGSAAVAAGHLVFADPTRGAGVWGNATNLG